MSSRPAGPLLDDILERIERIERFIAGLNRDAFLADDRTTDSVVRNLEVIGEAANRLPLALRDRYPGIPWRRIVGLRNRIVHDYFDVDLEIVWEILVTELPRLKEQLRDVRRQTESKPR
jgi:uncharacterized protein with HEPN domain